MAVVSINWKPSSRELRWFSGMLLILSCMLVLYYTVDFGAWELKSGRTQAEVAAILVGLTSTIGLLGLSAPQSIRWIYVGWMLAVFPIGWVVSHLLLAAIFFGVIMPIGLILRVLGRDPMRKSIDRSASTYWIARPTEPTDSQRYFRQF